MERRQVIGAIVSPLAAAGAASVFASLSPANAPYMEALRLFGASSVALSVGVWSALLLTAGTMPTPDQRKYISLGDAGAWLYQRTTPPIREAITRNVPNLYKTAEEGAEAHVKNALSKGVIDLYARRGAGFPMERVSSKEMQFDAFEELFGSDRPKLFDLSMRRGDLPKLIRHYKG